MQVRAEMGFGMASEITGTRFDVPPKEADWYYRAIIDKNGETDYVDGYASGARPLRSALQEHMRCRHSWVAGMAHVSDEDVAQIAPHRKVECEKCERSYWDRNRKPLLILEWKVSATPHGKYAHLWSPAIEI